MQQLNLFQTTRRRTVRRPLKQREKTALAHAATSYDLWNQDSEPDQEMALLFLDIRNFTQLASKHPAAEVIHIIKKLFSSFQQIIKIHRGQIIETTGDGFYAAFASGSLSESISDSVSAGHLIIKTLDQLNERTFSHELNQIIEIGIGIHAGKVASGRVRINGHNHLVVMGYAVNVASRIQSLTKELNNNFLVSEQVFKELNFKNETALYENVNLKGVTEPVNVYAIGRSYQQNNKPEA